MLGSEDPGIDTFALALALVAVMLQSIDGLESVIAACVRPLTADTLKILCLRNISQSSGSGNAQKWLQSCFSVSVNKEIT